MPVLAPHELLPWLSSLGLCPERASAERFWKHVAGTKWGVHPGAARAAQPLFVYGDDAEYTKYCDKMLGVYVGCLQSVLESFGAYICSCNIYIYWNTYIYIYTCTCLHMYTTLTVMHIYIYICTS